MPSGTMQSVGYKQLADTLELDCLPHYCESYVAERGGRRTEIQDDRRVEVYRHGYMPGETPFDHLEFALKREGVNRRHYLTCAKAR